MVKSDKMKKTILFLILAGLFNLGVFAQEEEAPEKDRPVRAPFASGLLLDNQTTYIPSVKTLEYVIQHKFGNMQNGRSDLWGIYAPGANIRLGVNYVPFKNFQIGVGGTKKNMYADFNAKWTIVEQTRRNTIPVAVALYGVMAIDGRNESAFGSGQVVDTKGPTLPHSVNFQDRLSYFSQLIISRKFGEAVSLQAGASFSHYNMVVWDGDHDKIGLHFNGRVNFSPQSSIIFNYDVPLKIKDISEQREWINHPEPNISIGWEIATSTHAFHIYAGTADGIVPQDMMMHNLNKPGWDSFALGFTITRLWNF